MKFLTFCCVIFAKSSASPIMADLTFFPLPSVRLSLCLSLVVGFFFLPWVLLLWLLVDFHGLWWWLFLLLLVGCEVQVYLEGLEVGFVWFWMGFEVYESGGLWVSCGSGTVVVAVIWWLWWWLLSGCGFFYFYFLFFFLFFLFFI